MHITPRYASMDHEAHFELLSMRVRCRKQTLDADTSRVTPCHHNPQHSCLSCSGHRISSSCRIGAYHTQMCIYGSRGAFSAAQHACTISRTKVRRQNVSRYSLSKKSSRLWSVVFGPSMLSWCRTGAYHTRMCIYGS